MKKQEMCKECKCNYKEKTFCDICKMKIPKDKEINLNRSQERLYPEDGYYLWDAEVCSIECAMKKLEELREDGYD